MPPRKTPSKSASTPAKTPRRGRATKKEQEGSVDGTEADVPQETVAETPTTEATKTRRGRTPKAADEPAAQSVHEDESEAEAETQTKQPRRGRLATKSTRRSASQESAASANQDDAGASEMTGNSKAKRAPSSSPKRSPSPTNDSQPTDEPAPKSTKTPRKKQKTASEQPHESTNAVETIASDSENVVLPPMAKDDEMTDAPPPPPSAPAPKSMGPVFSVTVSDLQSDPVSKIADAHWFGKSVWKANVVKSVYHEHLVSSKFSLGKLMLLEFSQYFDYLWAHLDQSASDEHVLCAVMMINEKCRQRLSPFASLKDSDKLAVLVRRAADLTVQSSKEGALPCLLARRQLVLFFDNALANLEFAPLRTEVMRLFTIGMWHSLGANLDSKLSQHASLPKLWAHYEKKFGAASDDEKRRLQFERQWLPSLIELFFDTLSKSVKTSDHLMFCERVLELVTDLVSQLPTRRFTNTLLQHLLVSVRCRLSPLFQNEQPEGKLLRDLLARLDDYLAFPVNDFSGVALGEEDITDEYYKRMQQVQKLVFEDDLLKDKLKEFVFGSVSALQSTDTLRNLMSALNDDELRHFCSLLGVPATNTLTQEPYSNDILLEATLKWLAKKSNHVDAVDAVALYPDEHQLWNRALLDTEMWSGEKVLALPKINLQFLSIHDYLLRNFELLRLESAHAIRQDIEDAVARSSPRMSTDPATNFTVFAGWARMAVPVELFTVGQIGAPLVGETNPSHVKADLTFSVGRFNDKIRGEWNALKKHDILFLVSVKAPAFLGSEKWTGGDMGIDSTGRTFQDFFGIEYVRGCEVVEFVGDDGRMLQDEMGKPRAEGSKASFGGHERTVRVLLDPTQYAMDMDPSRKSNDCYTRFNLVVRRNSRENNFKAVLETIRDLMRTPAHAVPEWLQSVFLGFGDPKSVHHSRMRNYIEQQTAVKLQAAGGSGELTEEQKRSFRTIDFQDTFLDWSHLEEGFADKRIEKVMPSSLEQEKARAVAEIYRRQGIDADAGAVDGDELLPPFVVTFNSNQQSNVAVESSRKKKQVAEQTEQESLEVTSYSKSYAGPYPEDIPRRNQVRFTPAQIEAIRAGTLPGLTMVVGPPGTGKTDVAVQIISNIYHNNPSQHTLIITHSNQALNQLFEKLIGLDIDERHMIRLGHGEEELGVSRRSAMGPDAASYTKYGRVNSFLEKRVKLLAEVDRLAVSMGAVSADFGVSCDAASNFFTYHVATRWQKYQDKFEVQMESDADGISSDMVKEFPFGHFFNTAPCVAEKKLALFPKDASPVMTFEIARGCWRHLKNMFSEIEDIRPFEILQSNYDRANYMLTKEARIIAMTCTHAAIKRRELISLGFEYDNIVMEEAAQVLEVETFIPMLLQDAQRNVGAQLKRVVLIGDHHQLPPVVKNSAFQKYCNLDQSLFSRLVRLGASTVTLDAQGRCRPSLRALFGWNYEKLGDLPIIQQSNEVKFANPGFAHDFQVINVDDYMGRGETEPYRHFVQNLGEAEYVVAVYQYMRLMGYPAEKITILTTYNGQKALINDVINERCANHPLFGKPGQVSTVDRYQGQQNDYVLLSLVRTKTVGHLRDVRRLIVAMSRARLGLYVFCRASMFKRCAELAPVFDQLLSRPTKLSLMLGETYRRSDMDEQPGTARSVTDVKAKGSGQDWRHPKAWQVNDVTEMGQWVYAKVAASISEIGNGASDEPESMEFDVADQLQ